MVSFNLLLLCSQGRFSSAPGSVWAFLEMSKIPCPCRAVRGVLTKMYKVGMAFSDILWITANKRIQILFQNLKGCTDMIIQASNFLYEISLMILVRLIKMCLNETYSRV